MDPLVVVGGVGDHRGPRRKMAVSMSGRAMVGVEPIAPHSASHWARTLGRCETILATIARHRAGAARVTILPKPLRPIPISAAKFQTPLQTSNTRSSQRLLSTD
jgi:hypothetical protein